MNLCARTELVVSRVVVHNICTWIIIMHGSANFSTTVLEYCSIVLSLITEI